VKVMAKGLGLKEEPIFPVSALNNTGLEPLYNWFQNKLS